MITESEMYWLTRCDAIREMALGAIIFSLIVGACAAIAYMIAYLIKADWQVTEAEHHSSLSSAGIAVSAGACKVSGITAIVMAGLLMTGSVAYIFVPTTKEMAAIKVVPAIATDKVKGDAAELYDLTVDWMKTQLRANKDQ